LIIPAALYHYVRLLFVLRRPFLGGVLLLLLAGQTLASEQRILVLGDSISAAYGMSLEQGWVAQLGTHLNSDYPNYSVINASISGETTIGGLSRLPALIEKNKPRIVILELGANDGLRGYPLKTLQANLSSMVELAQKSGAKVILIPMEVPPNYGARYTDGFRDSFKRVAQDYQCALTPFVLENVALDPALMQEDGLHPTAEAQPLLLATILPTVLELLETL
jgi:acyl-CoA thioesterase-1